MSSQFYQKDERAKLGLVTDDNSGGYFVVECESCGWVYPSFELNGGGPIADTGDYDECMCPKCGHVDPSESDNVGLVWNIQQEKINVIQSRLNAVEAENERLREALKFYADKEHFHFEGDDWDSVSGEPHNILWHSEEPYFVENGYIAKQALEGKA